MERTIPDDEREHFDFWFWCKCYYSELRVSDVDVSKQIDFVHEIIYDANQVMQLTIGWQLGGPDYHRYTSYGTNHMLSYMGTYVEETGLRFRIEEALVALEHNAETLGLYDYGYGSPDHLPAISTLEDLLNFSHDVIESVYQASFEEVQDLRPLQGNREYEFYKHMCEDVRKEIHPLPRPHQDNPKPANTKKMTAEEIYTQLQDHQGIAPENRISFAEAQALYEKRKMAHKENESQD